MPDNSARMRYDKALFIGLLAVTLDYAMRGRFKRVSEANHARHPEHAISVQAYQSAKAWQRAYF
jgi:hypothetical protein